MSVYLRAKFEVSSVILTGFRNEGGGVILPHPPPQNEPLKSPPRLGLIMVIIYYSPFILKVGRDSLMSGNGQ